LEIHSFIDSRETFPKTSGSMTSPVVPLMRPGVGYPVHGTLALIASLLAVKGRVSHGTSLMVAAKPSSFLSPEM